MELNDHTDDAPPAARTHRGAVYALLIAGTLTTFLAIAAIWVNRQVLETDNWTETSSELLEDQEIRAAVSTVLVDQLYAKVDVTGELRAALPPRAAPLAAPAAGAVRNLAERGANEALQRPRVQALWENANRVAHEQLLRIVKGGGEGVSTDNGTVTLNLGVILQDFADRTGVGGRAAEKIGPDGAQIEVLRSDQLGFAQDVANLLRPLALVLTLLALAMFGGAIALARDRRRQTLRAAGFGFIVAGILALVLRSLAGGAIVDALAKTEAVRPAVESVWRIGTSLLVEVATAAIIYGVVAVLAAWLAGPTRAAVASRRGLAPYLRQPAWAYGALTVIVLLLVWWGPVPAARRLIPGLILLALLIAGVAALRRQTAREYPDAQIAELGPALRARAAALRSGRQPAQVAGLSGNGADAPAPVAVGPEEMQLAGLERLADLHDRGALSDDEFSTQKRQLLAAGS